MGARQQLTEEEHSAVKVFCEKIDEYLARLKDRQNLEELTNSDDLGLFEEIVNLTEGPVRSAVTQYLASREDIFKIFELSWDILVKRSISSSPGDDGLLYPEKWIAKILKLTDCSDDICLAFGQKGLIRVVTKSLKRGNLEENLEKTLRAYALAFMYNCCWRVPENRVICREFIDILQDLSRSEAPDTQADAFLALSYIIDKEETHMIKLNKLCVKFLLSVLRSATVASGVRSRVYGYSALEILQGIHQLAINDNNKILIVKLGGIDVLERILVEEGSNNDERRWTARVIWQLAFKEENKVKIRQCPTLLCALHKIKATTESCDVLDACSGALFVINDVLDIDDVAKGHTPRSEDHGDRSGETEVLSSGHEEGHIMISYQHASHERMLQVKRYLEKCGYNVWMDVDQMKGDILDTMAKAVQGASVVLICLTRKFNESQHCRTEATYAYTLKKDIIPLMLQDNFSPKDWLGALMGMKMWFPMFSDHLMRQYLPNLVKELGDRGKRDRVVPVLDQIAGTSPPTSGQIQKDETAAVDEVDLSHVSGGIRDDKPTDKEDEVEFSHVRGGVKDDKPTVEEDEVEFSHVRGGVKDDKPADEEDEVEVIHVRGGVKDDKPTDKDEVVFSHVPRGVKDDKPTHEEDEVAFSHASGGVKDDKPTDKDEVVFSHVPGGVRDDKPTHEEDEVDFSHASRGVKDDKPTDKDEVDFSHVPGGVIDDKPTDKDEVVFSHVSGGVKDDKPTNREDKESSRSEKSVDVDTWDEEEAGKWLRSNCVDTSKDVFKEVNGTRLMQIKNLLNLAPEFCLKSLRKDLGLDFWDVLSVVDALKKL